MSDLDPKDRLGRAEVNKDALQNLVDAGAETVGAVTNIVVGAVRDVSKALGDFGTEVFEIRDAARKARAANQPDDAN